MTDGKLSKRQPTTLSSFTALLLTAFGTFGGTWIPLDHPAPDNVQLMLLMTDGTVMAAGLDGGQGGNHWYKLTPDKNGSYVHGTWSTLAQMTDTRLFFSSVVLRDGRLFVAGGEYGTGGATAEIYDPKANVWTPVPIPTDLLDPTQPSPANTNKNQAFLDSDAILLPDGRVMVAPVRPKNAFDVLIYDPVATNWISGPNTGLGNQNEASWVKLPDESILTVDAGSTTAERFLPENYLPGHIHPVAHNTWIPDADVPISLYGSPGNEIGPALLLQNGTAMFMGAFGNCAVYTPSGDDSPGRWTPGPVMPNVIQYLVDDDASQNMTSPITTLGAAPDAPAAMLVNGRILCALSGPLYNDPRVTAPPNDYWKTQKNPQYPKPTTFFVYDPVAQTFTPILDPYGNSTENVFAYQTAMLGLPDGTVLFADQAPQLFVYALDPAHYPEDQIDPANRPTVSTITPNPDGSWHLTGTQINGLSQGAAYGDDAQVDSNYPLVRFVADSGEVTYARTFNWSSTGVQTKDQRVSTDFTLPPIIAGTGSIHLEVVANGIASSQASFPLVLPGEVLTFSGNSSMGTNGYEISGGITTLQDDGSASGNLLRGPGGIIQLIDSATADTATISVDGGMGNGGIPGFLRFMNYSTAAASTILNRGPALGPNFKNAGPNPDNGWGGTTEFSDNATAGTAHIVNEGEDHAGASNGAAGGITKFSANASADQATLETLGSPVDGTGGYIEFSGQATAGHATITNGYGATGYVNANGHTAFFDTATASNATIVNIGGAGGNLEAGGATEFRNSTRAGTAMIHNYGGTGGLFPGPGTTAFFDTASAANATFINHPGQGSGGDVIFHGHSTAADGIFINDSPMGSVGGAAGNVIFHDDSVASQAHFTTTGYYGGQVYFYDRSSADHALFGINSNVYSGSISFIGTSTADHGNFDISGGGQIQFQNSATASNAIIVLHANGTVGKSSAGSFSGDATAASANITVMGAELPGVSGAYLGVQGPATLGNATVTVNGAAFKTAGSSGGSVSFDYGGSLGSATFVINGGMNGGPGGGIRFNGAPANQAHIILNAGATMDVSGLADNHVGSLEGAGNVWIDHALLAVGALNTDKTFSGVISGRTTPPFGAFAKEGTGTLWLGGTNTFGGLSTVAAGTLVVSGSLASDVHVNSGATFKGCGHVDGTVTTDPGAIVSPGCSPGTLTIGGNYVQNSQGILEMEITGPNQTDRDLLIVNGNVNLGGTLLLVFSGYAPSANESFPVIQVGGNFNDNNFKIAVLGLQPGFQPTYQFSNGTLTLTATSNGQLRCVTDPLQTLAPSFAPQSGFVFPVFTLAGANYEFDTSTDFQIWTPLSVQAGANVLFEFRHVPPTGEPHRFYRVLETAPNP